MEKIKVVGIDYPCLDYIVETERLPGTNGECDVGEYSWQGGGMVPTALAALGRLGVKTGLIGISGDDIYGKYCALDLERHGVDLSQHIFDKNGTTDFCVCVAERATSGRSFITRWGTRRRITTQDISADYIGQAEFLHLCGEMDNINLDAAKKARSRGVRVAIDADHYSRITIERLEYIDVLIASQKFYEAAFSSGSVEENCRALSANGPETVVFTFGSRGSAGIGGGEYFEVPIFDTPVKDTTGAGDVFHGAYIYALLKKMQPAECARFATAVSSIKCTRIGGRAGIPDLETVEKFLESGKIDYTGLDKRVEYYRDGLGNLLGGKQC